MELGLKLLAESIMDDPYIKFICRNHGISNPQEIAEKLQKEKENMIIIFDGDTLKLLDDLEQFSGKSQKLTLNFMLENFKILTEAPTKKPEETGNGEMRNVRSID